MKVEYRVFIELISLFQVYVIGGLQLATILIATTALFWAIKCQKTVSVTKYVYRNSPPFPNSLPPVVPDHHHYDTPDV